MDRVSSSLQQHLRFAEKMETKRNQFIEKRSSAASEQSRLQPALKGMIERTRELQAQIEQSISKKYNNRPVHVTGGVTSI